MTTLSIKISVSARRSTADRSSHASDGERDQHQPAPTQPWLVLSSITSPLIMTGEYRLLSGPPASFNTSEPSQYCRFVGGFLSWFRARRAGKRWPGRWRLA